MDRSLVAPLRQRLLIRPPPRRPRQQHQQQQQHHRQQQQRMRFFFVLVAVVAVLAPRVLSRSYVPSGGFRVWGNPALARQETADEYYDYGGGGDDDDGGDDGDVGDWEDETRLDEDENMLDEDTDEYTDEESDAWDDVTPFQAAVIDPKGMGFWEYPCGPHIIPPVKANSWEGLQLLLGDMARRLGLLSGEVGGVTHQWLANHFGETAARNFEKIHNDLPTWWLPQPVQDPQGIPAESLLADVPEYQQTYYDIQAYCVLIEQAYVDHKANETAYGKAQYFQDLANTVNQVLCTMRSHLIGLESDSLPPANRSIMPNEVRYHEHFVIARDYMGMHQLVEYLEAKRIIFLRLKELRDKAPDFIKNKPHLLKRRRHRTRNWN